MNTRTIVTRAHRTSWLAAGGWVIASAACGNESVNVLAPRDVSVEVDANADSIDVSIEAPVDMSVDSPVEVSVDAPLDAFGDVSPIDAPADALVDPIVPGDGGPTGCMDPGELCSFAGACCSLACQLPGPRRCVAGPICLAAGAMCADNADCCSNRCEGGRCFGVSVGTCLPAGEPCTTNDNCCGARCVPTDGGESRCKLLWGCRVVREICTKDLDCCSGRCASDGLRNLCMPATPCTTAGRMCSAQAGDRCTDTTECCEGTCSPDPDGLPRCSWPTSCRAECVICAEPRHCCSGRCEADDSGLGSRRCEGPIF